MLFEVFQSCRCWLASFQPCLSSTHFSQESFTKAYCRLYLSKPQTHGGFWEPQAILGLQWDVAKFEKTWWKPINLRLSDIIPKRRLAVMLCFFFVWRPSALWGPDSISTEESIIQLQVQCDGAICLDNSPQVSFQNTRVHFLHGFSFNREFLSLKCSTNLKTVKNACEICEACLQAHIVRLASAAVQRLGWLVWLTKTPLSPGLGC